jgi:hypothetical protein
MNNQYFIGAKNVCIVAVPTNKKSKYNITNFIYHCDKLFGWASQYYKKNGSNKIYVIFPTLTRGKDLIYKLHYEDIIVQFPNDVFLDNIAKTVRISGVLGHSEKEQHLFLPNIENFQIVHNRLENLESDLRHKINEFTNLDDYINNKFNLLNKANTCKYQEEIETLKNKVGQLENDNRSLQYVISQQTMNINLILSSYIKVENDLKKLDKWTETTQNIVCDNTLKINEIKKELQNNNLCNIVTNLQKEIYQFQQWADIKEGSITENTINIKSIIQKNNEIKQSLDQNIAKINKNMIEMKERNKWHESTGQHQHIYALEKCGLFEKRITALEKKYRTNETKIDKLELENTSPTNINKIIENIAQYTTNLVSLDALTSIQNVANEVSDKNTELQSNQLEQNTIIKVPEQNVENTKEDDESDENNDDIFIVIEKIDEL